MPRPVITKICREIIPQGAEVIIYGDNFVDGQTEVFLHYLFTSCYTPSTGFGDCGSWSDYPGTSIGNATVGSPRSLRFNLPTTCLLTEDERTTVAGGQVHEFSRLSVLVRVTGEGYSNIYPDPPNGLRVIAPPTYSDPPDVDTRPLEELENLLLNMINEIRGWYNKAPVTMHGGLRDVARQHAQLMNHQWGNEGWVDHTSCSGWSDCSTDPHQAPGEDSPQARVESNTGLHYAGEIVNFCWGINTPLKNFSDSWDNSCEHRSVMLSDNVSLIGVGISRSIKISIDGFSAYYYTVTCDFAR
ncbi:MAG: CAP domain-containing protein [Methanolinea sp.]|nr:CAP domain-containing protein [Methanolinea sp.]